MKFLQSIFDLLAKLFGSTAHSRIGEPSPTSPASSASPITASPALVHHHVLASSFADPADVAAFRRCKERGGSDEECFKHGDNGIGAWGDDTTAPIPMCALPPEDLQEKWGSIDAARRKKVYVSANGRDVLLLVGDRMPHREHIKNGAGIDLNPAACAALNLRPPVMHPAIWSWV